MQNNGYRRSDNVMQLPVQKPVAERRGVEPAKRRLRIAMLAPPWIPVPPPGYGGIEFVLTLLCEALVERGHDVELFCAPGSRSSATVRPLLDAAHPESIERSLFEADHVARAFHAIEAAARRGQPFDLVHDHSGYTALAMADRLAIPVVHTAHGPFDADTAPFYAHHGKKGKLVCISHAQASSAPSDGASGSVASRVAAARGSSTRGSGTSSVSGARVSRPSQAPSNEPAHVRMLSALTIQAPLPTSISTGNGRRSPTRCSTHVPAGR